MINKPNIYLSLFAALTLFTDLVWSACESVQYQSIDYIVCSVDSDKTRPALFLNDPSGKPWKSVTNLAKGLNNQVEFIMNIGMYHDDYSPVGLYVENFQQIKAINTNDGPGNFHLKPNGIFHFTVDKTGAAEFKVEETEQYLSNDRQPQYATQSGPMLVINNQLHPRFLPKSDSLHIRNGVGVTEFGEVKFVISKQPVNFYTFAHFFKDYLNTPNALYLDGKISTLYAPPLPTIKTWFYVGPMFAAVIK